MTTRAKKKAEEKVANEGEPLATNGEPILDVSPVADSPASLASSGTNEGNDMTYFTTAFPPDNDTFRDHASRLDKQAIQLQALSLGMESINKSLSHLTNMIQSNIPSITKDTLDDTHRRKLEEARVVKKALLQKIQAGISNGSDEADLKSLMEMYTKDNVPIQNNISSTTVENTRQDSALPQEEKVQVLGPKETGAIIINQQLKDKEYGVILGTKVQFPAHMKLSVVSHTTDDLWRVIHHLIEVDKWRLSNTGGGEIPLMRTLSMELLEQLQATDQTNNNIMESYETDDKIKVRLREIFVPRGTNSAIKELNILAMLCKHVKLKKPQLDGDKVRKLDVNPALHTFYGDIRLYLHKLNKVTSLVEQIAGLKLSDGNRATKLAKNHPMYKIPTLIHLVTEQISSLSPQIWDAIMNSTNQMNITQSYEALSKHIVSVTLQMQQEIIAERAKDDIKDEFVQQVIENKKVEVVSYITPRVYNGFKGAQKDSPDSRIFAGKQNAYNTASNGTPNYRRQPDNKGPRKLWGVRNPRVVSQKFLKPNGIRVNAMTANEYMNGHGQDQVHDDDVEQLAMYLENDELESMSRDIQKDATQDTIQEQIDEENEASEDEEESNVHNLVAAMQPSTNIITKRYELPCKNIDPVTGICRIGTHCNYNHSLAVQKKFLMDQMSVVKSLESKGEASKATPMDHTH